MKVKHLAEAVILQAMEDLWSEEHREECINFFTGEDFRSCASIAAMDTSEQIKILEMLDKLIKGMQKPAKLGKKMSYKYMVPRTEMREVART
jgi:hypothetical protein